MVRLRRVGLNGWAGGWLRQQNRAEKCVLVFLPLSGHFPSSPSFLPLSPLSSPLLFGELVPSELSILARDRDGIEAITNLCRTDFARGLEGGRKEGGRA